MSEAAYVISKLLVAEATTGDKDSESWNNVIDSYVLNLLKLRRMEMLSIPTRLAIAISIIGSQRLDLFTTAFRLLCDWQHIGGPYWLVQEEILRFSAIHLFRCEMNNQNPDKSVTTSNIRKLLPDVLPNDLPPYVTHKIVKKRMHFLRTEFEWLLDDIRRGSRDEAEAIFKEYTDRFPMNNFVDWFLEWAQSLLHKFEELSLHNTSSSGSNIQSVCRKNMCSTPIPEKQVFTASLPAVPRRYIVPIIARTVFAENNGNNNKRNNSSRDIMLKEDRIANTVRSSESDHYQIRKAQRTSFKQNTPHQQDEITGNKVPATADDNVMPSPILHQKSQSASGQIAYTHPTLGSRKRGHIVASDHVNKTINMQFLSNDLNLKVSIPQVKLTKCIGYPRTVQKQKKVYKHVVVTVEKKIPDREEASISDKPVDPFGLEGNENRVQEANEDEVLTPPTGNMRECVDNCVNDTRGSVGHDEDEQSGEDQKSECRESNRMETGGETPHNDLASHLGAMGLGLEEEEPRKFISPLTPTSGSGSSQLIESNHTAPQVEESNTPTLTEKSESAASDGGTEYYESASEDSAEGRGIFNTLARSVWSIFSPNNQ